MFPEEKVRIAFIEFLTSRMGVPDGLISRERVVEGSTGRYDLVVHSRTGGAWMLVECKAPTVGLTQDVIDQAAAYNQHLDARYLVVTNGSETLCFEIDREDRAVQSCTELPMFPER